MNLYTQHRFTQQRKHYQNLLCRDIETLTPIEQALGKDYEQKLLDCLKKYKSIGVTQLSTVAIMDELGWRGKSYYANKALKQLQSQNKITGIKVYHWLWSIKND